MLSLVTKLRNVFSVKFLWDEEAGKFIHGLVLFFLILLIFKTWFFSFAPLTSGDLSYLFEENIRESSLRPFLWNGKNNLGEVSLYRWNALYSGVIMAIASFLKMSWSILVRIFWLWPFLILSTFSSAYLFRTLFPHRSLASLFSCLVYVANTYILMIVGGGQMGVALAYSLAPLVFGLFINLLTSSRVHELRRLVLTGLVLAIQVMFDPRIAYVTMMGVGVYWIIGKLTSSRVKELNNSLINNSLINNKIIMFVIPFLVVLGLHMYWILPMMILRSAGLENLGEAYTTTEAVKYFSFAQFSNTISLLHPNWPENIFGKVYFMRPEFLILPILAFSSLLFINYSRVKELNNSLINNSLITNKIILYFNLLGLIGAFLAKGANGPFGGVYLWLFKYFPGMVMFRDPTKFYTLIALSYSVLIPFSISRIYYLLRKLTS